MCTVTFIARQRGYCLGMNRDEKLTRPTGVPPKEKSVNGRAVISPSEPGGGTWIAVNDHGATFALINWHSIKARVNSNAVSRGDRKSTRLNSSHGYISYAVFCLKKKKLHPPQSGILT